MHDNASEIVLQVMGVAGLFFILFLIYTLYRKLYDKYKKTSHKWLKALLVCWIVCGLLFYLWLVGLILVKNLAIILME